jgi:hypothetical protein
MKHLLYLLIAASTLLVSCEKNALNIPADIVTAGARLKVINAAPDLPGGVEVGINGTKFTAFTPSGATASSPGYAVGLPFGSSYPSSGSNYAIVSPGAQSLSLTSPAASTVTSATAIGTASATLDDNAYYSLFISGTGVQPETVLLKDDFSQLTAPTKFYVRFVNLIPGTSHDLYLLGADGKTYNSVVQGVTYKSSSLFLTLDVVTNPTLVLRAFGTTVNLGTAVTFGSLANGRVLTLVAKGVFGRTGAAAPSLSLYVNR